MLGKVGVSPILSDVVQSINQSICQLPISSQFPPDISVMYRGHFSYKLSCTPEIPQGNLYPGITTSMIIYIKMTLCNT
jgi:hypothetical protein